MRVDIENLRNIVRCPELPEEIYSVELIILSSYQLISLSAYQSIGLSVYQLIYDRSHEVVNGINSNAGTIIIVKIRGSWNYYC